MNKILLDTNVLIYLFDASNIFHSRAKSIFADPSRELCVTSKNLTEFISVCTKMTFDPTNYWGLFHEIVENTTVLFPNSNSLTIFERLVKTYNPRGNRVFDIEIVSIALAHGISDRKSVV